MRKLRFIEGCKGEALQDNFVLDILSSKENGYYLEVGGSLPEYGNNTYILEKKYGWKGISFEIDEEILKKYNLERENKGYLCDATNFEYAELLKSLSFPKQIDYLQVDIDPADNSLKALKNLPFNQYRFTVITFEHDLYANENNKAIQAEQEEFLSSRGYIRFAKNVKVIPQDGTKNCEWKAFEDWWVDGNLINLPRDYYKDMRFTDIFAVPKTLKYRKEFRPFIKKHLIKIGLLK